MKQIIKELRQLNEEVPVPLKLPTKTKVEEVEKILNLKFHPDYVSYLLEASDVVLGAFEPAQVTEPESHTFLVEIAKSAWADMGVPKELLPICEDNGDYYCMTLNGEVVFWSHNGLNDEKWSCLSDWIQEVWIDES